MTRLNSNSDLHEYLLLLAGALDNTTVAPLADEVRKAASLRVGMPTEFLGEALIALKKVREAERGSLDAGAREDLERVIRQLEFALTR
jgi:hypothetical protein